MMRSLFETPAISVGELVRRIRQSLYAQFPGRYRVIGEVSKCTENNGNLYFKLKDAHGIISCVCFRANAQELRIPLPLADGLAVEVEGRVDTYESQYQLRVRDIAPVGTGVLYLQLQRLKERLDAEGLFAKERKRRVPSFIRDVAIVTSQRGAALQDFIATCRRRGAHVRIEVVHAQVQGAAAAPSIVRALRKAGQLRVDVVVVARGGGSLEDLYAFNTEAVARAIAQCPHPVITAIGHKPDLTIADLVADRTADTPTAAAEFVALERSQLLDRIGAAQGRLRKLLLRSIADRSQDAASIRRQLLRCASTVLATRAQRVDELGSAVARCDPRRRIAGWHDRVETALRRMRILPLRALDARRTTLERETAALRSTQRVLLKDLAKTFHIVDARLAAIAPERTLARGYAIVHDAAGGIVTDVERARPGDPIDVELAGGWLGAQVQSVRKRA